jgi:hypothetical protein
LSQLIVVDKKPDPRWPDEQTNAGLCELQEIGSEFRFKVTADDGISLLRSVTIQALRVVLVTGNIAKKEISRANHL